MVSGCHLFSSRVNGEQDFFLYVTDSLDSPTSPKVTMDLNVTEDFTFHADDVAHIVEEGIKILHAKMTTKLRDRMQNVKERVLCMCPDNCKRPLVLALGVNNEKIKDFAKRNIQKSTPFSIHITIFYHMV